MVVGHPNYLGAFEGAVSAPLICLTGPWSALRPVPEEVTSLVVAPNHRQGVAAEALENARRLAKRLRQRPGVDVALRPQSPILVLLLRSPLAADECPEGVEALDGVYPEMPGGVRVELAPDMTMKDVNRYAANLERIISQEG